MAEAGWAGWGGGTGLVVSWEGQSRASSSACARGPSWDSGQDWAISCEGYPLRSQRLRKLHPVHLGHNKQPAQHPRPRSYHTLHRPPMSESIEPFRTSFGTTRLLCRVTNNDPARSPVVCIHGLFSNSNLFEPLVSHLRAANLPNILSFDLPGFGRSPPFLSGSGGEEAGVGANRVGEEGRRPGHTIDHYTETIKAFVEAHAFAEGRCASLVCHGEGCFLVSSQHSL